MSLDRTTLDALQAQIEALRHVGEDYLILSVGVRGPNLDCHEGNAVATVRMGDDTATSEALHLQDAISLARGKILRERNAREEKRKKDKAAKEETQ
jgi:hypothetical protein